ncbi:unnamed protein product [Spirodela intermedia]|uniref:TFIIS N-terminal domain-containing protein n=1 Tax=Spirodela intermedia TaxID=51605 RepID=A0A7I8K619_SPIIN|nr:unnamed protein product [Spirodela intermedia]
MAERSARLDYWRKYFRSADSSIFEVIEQAILVAAADCPEELRRRRDRIALVLFSCQLPRCHGCEKARPASPEEEEGDDGGAPAAAGCAKERKASSRCSIKGEEDVKMVVSNYSYDEAEALTEEIEEETQMIGEVLRIKEILFHKDDETDSVLFESLRRLQLMVLSVEALKVTEIGKAVSGLRKHSSKQIRALVRTLIEGWKVLVDEWVSTAALTEGTPESVNPSVVDDEEGLPSPPMDEGILFTTQPSLELSQFFDGMDDDGNLQGGEGYPGDSMKVAAAAAAGRAGPPDAVNRHAEDLGRSGPKQLGPVSRRRDQSVSGMATGPGRPQEPVVEGKLAGGMAAQRRQGPAVGTAPKKPPLVDRHDKCKSAEEMSVRVKLEAAKRKLHEGYQQAENAKKQRTIQVMELQDIPRQGGIGHRQPSVKQQQGSSLSRLRATCGRR